MDAFEDLDVWKRSTALAAAIHRSFRHCREPSLRDQIIRSAVSIPSNIAEGFERNSPRQFVQFLLIAKGSRGELRTQIHLGREMGLIGGELGETLYNEAVEVARMLQGLINYCRKHPNP
jgi:four helix bundle protein